MELKKNGVIFVDELTEVPKNSIVIFSAHGVSKKIEEDAAKLLLQPIDATCPLVKKVHFEAKKYEQSNKKIILIGHKNHPEVEGTSGQVSGNVFLVQNVQDVDSLNITANENVAYITQTTLSVDDTKEIILALKSKFINLEGPELKDICYATQNRQDAVKTLAKSAEMVLVIGSKNSSNSNRLRDIAKSLCPNSYLIDTVDDIDTKWLANLSTIGITAGASAPDVILDEVLSFLGNYYGNIDVSVMDGIEENIKFKLPKELELAC